MRKILILICLGLCGCASNSGVVPMGNDTYMVSRQAATGFSGSGTLKAEALQEASKFCEKQGKMLQVVSTSEAQPPYIWANFPKAEVQFMCLDANDPQLQRPRLKKTPAAQDNVITKSTGTGFAISEEGLIVTAHHVVKDASSIKIHLNNGPVVKAKIYKSDPSNDIAILKIDVPTTNYLPIAPLRTAKTGERVSTIGFPISSVLGQEAKYTEGVISSLSGIEGAASFLQITVPVQPGNSGGPLVNENGYVVGIISSSAAVLPFLANTGTIPQNINWAVKADYLRPLVDLPSDKAIQLNRDELIEKARRSVVLIEATNE